MEPAMTRTDQTRWTFAPAIVALVIAAGFSAMSTAPALAQGNDRDHGRQVQHHEASHARDRNRGHYELHSYARPAYVYSPPPVYYAPPPGPPVIDFVFPFVFR